MFDRISDAAALTSVTAAGGAMAAYKFLGMPVDFWTALAAFIAVIAGLLAIGARVYGWLKDDGKE